MRAKFLFDLYSNVSISSRSLSRHFNLSVLNRMNRHIGEISKRRSSRVSIRAVRICSLHMQGTADSAFTSR